MSERIDEAPLHDVERHHRAELEATQMELRRVRAALETIEQDSQREEQALVQAVAQLRARLSASQANEERLKAQRDATLNRLGQLADAVRPGLEEEAFLARGAKLRGVSTSRQVPFWWVFWPAVVLGMFLVVYTRYFAR